MGVERLAVSAIVDTVSTPQKLVHGAEPFRVTVIPITVALLANFSSTMHQKHGDTAIHARLVPIRALPVFASNAMNALLEPCKNELVVRRVGLAIWNRIRQRMLHENCTIAMAIILLVYMGNSKTVEVDAYRAP